MSAKLKVRQPLAKVEVVLADNSQQAWLCEHDALIREELNVKLVEFTTHAEQYIDYTVLPDLKNFGPKIGKRLPLLKQASLQADAAALLKEMQAAGKVTLPTARRRTARIDERRAADSPSSQTRLGRRTRQRMRRRSFDRSECRVGRRRNLERRNHSCDSVDPQGFEA